MQYQEINLFNTAFIPSFVEKRPIPLYVREDIIDAEKIAQICNDSTEWKLVEYQDHAYYMAWVPLHNHCTRLKHGIIHHIGFYVLTDAPSMFDTAHNGHTMDWLKHYWDKLFLMTTPVLKYVPKSSARTHDVHIDYFVPNKYPMQKVLVLDHSIHTTWLEQLQTRSYTLGNGLTIFLSMIKSGQIPARIGKTCIQELFRRHGTELFQQVSDRWMELYYGHPTMHVCDNPYFYCAMGNPSAPFDVFQMFAPHDDDVVMNISHGNTRIVSTLRSVILTNFRPDWWDRIMGDAWYECPLDINMEDEYTPNIASFFLSMVRTKHTWQWWMSHHAEYLLSLRALLSTYYSPIRMLEQLLQPVLHFYGHAQEHSPTLCYSRLRMLWSQILTQFDPNCEYIIPMIQRWSLRYSFVHTLKVGGYISQPGWEFEAPVAFLKDVVQTYREKCELFKPIQLRIYSEYDRMIVRTYPDLQHDTALRSNFNTVQVLQIAPPHSTFHIFYQTWLKPVMESRVCGIYRGFGMLENKVSTVPKWRTVSGLHTVGFLVLEHIKSHPDILYA